MKKIFLIIIFLAGVPTWAQLKGTTDLLFDTTPEPPFYANTVHTYYGDTGDYDTTTYTYHYRLSGRCVTSGRSFRVITYQIDSGTHLVNYNQPIDTVYWNYGYTMGYYYPEYDLNGHCNMRMQTTGGEARAFRKLEKNW
jgi:hypothetical protein